jgi:hypothetical protein
MTRGGPGMSCQGLLQRLEFPALFFNRKSRPAALPLVLIEYAKQHRGIALCGEMLRISSTPFRRESHSLQARFF